MSKNLILVLKFDKHVIQDSKTSVPQDIISEAIICQKRHNVSYCQWLWSCRSFSTSVRAGGDVLKRNTDH
jgi:hypothetical protein